MADIELRMEYRSAAAKLGLSLSAATFPLWGILAPTALILFIALLLRLPANVPLAYAIGMIALFCSIIGGGAACTLICEDDKIKVSPDGLIFPLRFAPQLKFKILRTWDELKRLAVRWERKQQFTERDEICLYFGDGGALRLNLDLLKRQELEQFFIAIEMFAYKCQSDPELRDLELSVQCKDGKKQYSDFELWEMQIADNFAATKFVPLEPGSKLQNGRLEVVRQLSFGGFGAIYLVRSADGKLAVLKENAGTSGSAEAEASRKMLASEAAILAKLDHPNIPRMLDSFVENERQYLQLEHVPGTSLNQIVRKEGVQCFEKVRDWMSQTIAAVAYLHGKDVYHRDIAPDNLMLTPRGEIFLIDFGAAKEEPADNSLPGVGKTGFSAPESREGAADKRSDIWSLAATAAYLLSGQVADQPSSIVCNLSKTPDWFRSLLADCLSSGPEDRPTAEQFRERLAHSGEPLGNNEQIETAPPRTADEQAAPA